jgi:hypothetical protein
VNRPALALAIGAALGAAASGAAADRGERLTFAGVVCETHAASSSILCRRADGRGLRTLTSRDMIVVAAIRDKRIVWASENLVPRPDNPPQP